MSISSDPSPRVVQTTIGGKKGGKLPLPVTAKFAFQRTHWSLHISPTGSGDSGERRLRLAVSRLCELDAAVELALRTGKEVHRTIPQRPQPNDGPHTATEQLLPLLMPLSVDSDGIYSYQRQGIAWLLGHHRAILGDDMGLGKTLQALAAARRLIRFGRVAWIVIVAPKILVSNWVEEIVRWAPELSVATALQLGSHRSLRWKRLVRRAHVIVTSYEQLRDVPSVLIQQPPELIIADEAHRLRNISSLSTKGFSEIDANRIWALTGTPIERDAQDIVTLLSLLDSHKFSITDKSLHPNSLKARLRPYLLRRRKSDVLEELPRVIDQNEVLDLTKEQKEAYGKAIENHTKSEPNSSFLPLFNKLRMICDIDSATGASSKIERAVDAISDVHRAGEKVVVFSYVIEPLRLLQAKLQHSIRGIECCILIGDMSHAERIEALNRFKHDSSCTVLLASTRVASEGLTLTEANHVIFLNRWWNPSSNSQARDRVVRIGQTRVVRVRSFTCRGTVEERLDLLLREKSLTFEKVIESLRRPHNPTYSIDLFASFDDKTLV